MKTDVSNESLGMQIGIEKATVAYLETAPDGPYRDMVSHLVGVLMETQGRLQDVQCDLRYLTRSKTP